MVKTFLSSFLAGVCISIGGTVFIACTINGNKIIGSVFFCVALLSICMLSLYLYTGKIGYFVNSFNKNYFLNLLVGLAGNFVGTTLFGFILSFANTSFCDFAKELCSKKLELNYWVVLLYGFMCGILMYIAVSTYIEKNTIVGIVFGIPVFILCGFEHSIADMFYFAIGRSFSLKYLVFILIVIVGNALGGMLIPFIKKISENKKNKKTLHIK